MKKLLAMMLISLMLLTACSSEPKPEMTEDPYGNKTYLYRNEEGIAVKEKVETINGSYAWRYYDESGKNVIKAEGFNAEDEQTGYTLFEHDADGNMTKQTAYKTDGTETTRIEYTYENGKKTYQATYWSGVIGREEYFDEREYTTTTLSYENGELSERWENVYGVDGGPPIANLCYRPDDTLKIMLEYGEDENGDHMTTRTEFDENEEVIKISTSVSSKSGIKEEVLFER